MESDRSLFCWVIELIFASASEAVLDPRISPEPLHNGTQLWTNGRVNALRGRNCWEKLSCICLQKYQYESSSVTSAMANALHLMNKTISNCKINYNLLTKNCQNNLNSKKASIQWLITWPIACMPVCFYASIPVYLCVNIWKCAILHLCLCQVNLYKPHFPQIIYKYWSGNSEPLVNGKMPDEGKMHFHDNSGNWWKTVDQMGWAKTPTSRSRCLKSMLRMPIARTIAIKLWIALLWIISLKLKHSCGEYPFP